MCCNKTGWDTEKLKKRLKKGPVRFWKELYLLGRSDVKAFQYKPGTTKAKDAPRSYEEYCEAFPRGLHVYKKRNDYCGECIQIPVWGRLEDFICAGPEQAVFRKLTILQKDWDRRFRRPTAKERILLRLREDAQRGQNRDPIKWCTKKAVRLARNYLEAWISCLKSIISERQANGLPSNTVVADQLKKLESIQRRTS